MSLSVIMTRLGLSNLAPFGLVRYGVAPDHPRIKEIIKALHRVDEQNSRTESGRQREMRASTQLRVS
jgi:hypothetical protein